ncbi:MAG: SpoIIE family protein phosphatase [Bacteroidales bacterium]|nr:SpoIIE family protein phosphatase [Bacteroidales bacterium]
MNEENIFNQLLEDEQKHEAIEQKEQWKVLIVDDEEAIHIVIRLALDDFTYKNKEIQFFVANSAFKAKNILKQNSDIALILLDVVMESNTAGLELVKFIREELENHFIQIVLWTGQPGKAPKREVIFSYEINDYKTKIELNDDNIFTVVLASLRTYDAIITLESFRQSLEQKVIERTKEVVRQKEKIEKQKKHITDSILYAKNIQNAILSNEKVIQKIALDYFIFFKPRDIVSGDFYWFSEQNGKLFLAVVDCTGHGVPGAFMSMLGIAFLNEIISNVETHSLVSLQANEILNELREKVKIALHQSGNYYSAESDLISEISVKDGMDIALCIIDTETNLMQYAGANIPLYLIRNNKLLETHATVNPIGIYFNEVPFVNHKIQLMKNDILYLFSDGYIDQFGGNKGNKFYSKHFKKLLLKIQDKSMQEQKQTLEKTITDWIGNEYEQIDDILVIGVRIDECRSKAEILKAKHFGKK